MKNYSCYYDGANNVAEVIDTSAPMQRPDDCDFELIESGGESVGWTYTIHDYDGTSLTVKREGQTKEQLVILFATLLGLREAARE